MSIEMTKPDQVHISAILSHLDETVMFRVMRYWIDDEGKRRRAIAKLEWKEIESGIFDNVYDAASFFITRKAFESFASETASIAKPFREVFENDSTKSRDAHIQSLKDSIAVIERMFGGKKCTD